METPSYVFHLLRDHHPRARKKYNKNEGEGTEGANGCLCPLISLKIDTRPEMHSWPSSKRKAGNVHAINYRVKRKRRNICVFRPKLRNIRMADLETGNTTIFLSGLPLPMTFNPLPPHLCYCTPGATVPALLSPFLLLRRGTYVHTASVPRGGRETRTRHSHHHPQK